MKCFSLCRCVGVEEWEWINAWDRITIRMEPRRCVHVKEWMNSLEAACNSHATQSNVTVKQPRNENDCRKFRRLALIFRSHLRRWFIWLIKVGIKFDVSNVVGAWQIVHTPELPSVDRKISQTNEWRSAKKNARTGKCWNSDCSQTCECRWELGVL